MSREDKYIEYGLKTKAQMLEMTVEELSEYEDILYWNRSDACTAKAYAKKFGHLKQLEAPAEVVDITSEEEE